MEYNLLELELARINDRYNLLRGLHLNRREVTRENLVTLCGDDLQSKYMVYMKKKAHLEKWVNTKTELSFLLKHEIYYIDCDIENLDKDILKCSQILKYLTYLRDEYDVLLQCGMYELNREKIEYLAERIRLNKSELAWVLNQKNTYSNE